MLYNKNKWNPGKYVIQNNIKNLYNNCNAELFLRYILYECDIPALKTNKDVLDLINVYRKEENLQESFGNIYDGNSVGDQNAGVINSIRSYISAVSDNNNVPSEELLFNKNNDDLLKNGVNNLCRSSIYADTISYCNSSNILGILNILLKK